MSKLITRYGGWCALLLIVFMSFGAYWYQNLPDLTVRLRNVAEDTDFDISKKLDKVTFKVGEETRDIRDYLDPSDGARLILPNIYWDDVKVTLAIDGFEELTQVLPREKAGKEILFLLKPAPIDVKVVNLSGIPLLTIKHASTKERNIPDKGEETLEGILKFEQENTLVYSAPGYREKTSPEGLDYNRTHYQSRRSVVTNVVNVDFLEKEEATLMFSLDLTGLQFGANNPVSLSDMALQADNATRLAPPHANGNVDSLDKSIKVYPGPDKKFNAKITHPNFMDVHVNEVELKDNANREVTIQLKPKDGAITVEVTPAWHPDYDDIIVTIGNETKTGQATTFNLAGYTEYQVQISGGETHEIKREIFTILVIPNKSRTYSKGVHLEKQDLWEELTTVNLDSLAKMHGGEKMVSEFNKAMASAAKNPAAALLLLEKWKVSHQLSISYNGFRMEYGAADEKYIKNGIYDKYIKPWKRHEEKFREIRKESNTQPDKAKQKLAEWIKTIDQEFINGKIREKANFDAKLKPLDIRHNNATVNFNDLKDILQPDKIQLQDQLETLQAERDTIEATSKVDPVKAIDDMHEWSSVKLVGFEISLIDSEFKRDQWVVKKHMKPAWDSIMKGLGFLKNPKSKNKLAIGKDWLKFIRSKTSKCYEMEYKAILNEIEKNIHAGPRKKLKEYGGQQWVAASNALEKIKADEIKKAASIRNCVNMLNAWKTSQFDAVLILLNAKKRRISLVQFKEGDSVNHGAARLKLPVLGKEVWKLAWTKNPGGPNKITTGILLLGGATPGGDIFLWPGEKLIIRLERNPPPGLKADIWTYGEIEIDSNNINGGEPIKIYFEPGGDGTQPQDKERWLRPEFNGEELSLLNTTGRFHRPIGKFLQIQGAGKASGVNPGDEFIPANGGAKNRFKVIQWSGNDEDELILAVPIQGDVKGLKKDQLLNIVPRPNFLLRPDGTF